MSLAQHLRKYGADKQRRKGRTFADPRALRKHQKDKGHEASGIVEDGEEDGEDEEEDSEGEEDGDDIMTRMLDLDKLETLQRRFGMI
jgi:hypothetical protein